MAERRVQRQGSSSGRSHASVEVADHLAEMFETGEFSDVTVVAFGREYPLHRLVLSRCGYFRSLFRGSWRDSDCRRVDITTDDPWVTSIGIALALRWIYDARTDVADEHCVAVLATARMLCLDALVDRCASQLAHVLSDDTVVPLVLFGLRYGTERVVDACVDYLCVRMYDLALRSLERVGSPESSEGSVPQAESLNDADVDTFERRAFFHIPYAVFLRVITHPQLWVPNEYLRYQMAKLWVLDSVLRDPETCDALRKQGFDPSLVSLPSRAVQVSGDGGEGDDVSGGVKPQADASSRMDVRAAAVWRFESPHVAIGQRGSRRGTPRQTQQQQQQDLYDPDRRSMSLDMPRSAEERLHMLKAHLHAMHAASFNDPLYARPSLIETKQGSRYGDMFRALQLQDMSPWYELEQVKADRIVPADAIDAVLFYLMRLASDTLEPATDTLMREQGLRVGLEYDVSGGVAAMPGTTLPSSPFFFDGYLWYLDAAVYPSCLEMILNRSEDERDEQQRRRAGTFFLRDLQRASRLRVSLDTYPVGEKPECFQLGVHVIGWTGGTPVFSLDLPRLSSERPLVDPHSRSLRVLLHMEAMTSTSTPPRQGSPTRVVS